MAGSAAGAIDMYPYRSSGCGCCAAFIRFNISFVNYLADMQLITGIGVDAQKVGAGE